jgi:hypothetical protein
VKTYQLAFEILALNFLVALVAAGVWFLVGGPGALLALLALIGLGLLAFGWVPFEVRLLPDDQVEFRSLARRTVVPAREIVSIDSRLYRRGLIEVRHRRGIIMLARSFEELPDLLARLVAMNPRIRVGPSV